ncbi:MAG TPA: hypothetical protein VEU62_09515 [Bryobacterales bacterium]|nr:hypothetical protein [Bryobacterales bacterium]
MSGVAEDGMTNYTGELGELDAVCLQLEQLALALASGKPERLAEQAGRAEAAIVALERLARRAQQDRLAGPPQAGQALAGQSTADVMLRLAQIRRQTARIAEMLAHGEQVRAGMATILALFYGVHAGAQYSASGAPSLPNVPRLMAQG